MNVLVCAAGKYRATSQTAQAVAGVLSQQAARFTVLPPEKVGTVEQFNPVVLGSAIHLGQ